MPKYLCAVDPSLTCSGWAIFDLKTEKLKAVGKVRSLSAKYSLSDRLLDVQAKIQEVFKACRLKKGDILVCEAPTAMRDPRAAFRVEQVRGIFEAVARQRFVLVPGRINPRSVQREVMGLKGKQLQRERVKETALYVAHALYEDSLKQLGFPATIKLLKKHQDIVDAILVGRLALVRIKAASLSRQPLPKLFDERLTSRAPRLRR